MVTGPHDGGRVPGNSIDRLHGGCVMAKELRGRDVGPDRDAVVTAESEDEEGVMTPPRGS
jgi:hypothetical protein